MEIENFVNLKKTSEEISIQEIIEVLNLAKESFSETNKFAKYLEGEIIIISGILKEELGKSYLGGFGLGYPFYAKNEEGFLKINEKERIERMLGRG